MSNFETPLTKKLDNGTRNSLFLCPRSHRQAFGKVSFFIFRLTKLPRHPIITSLSIMPFVPLHRRLLDELDDTDRSFKRARLQKYLEDSGVELDFLPGPDSEVDGHDSDPELSSVSSLSSLSSLSSDLESNSQASHISVSLSDVEDTIYSNVQAELDGLRQKILTSRVLQDNPKVKKAPQIHLLEHWSEGNLNQYRRKVRVDPSTFNGLVEKIQTHPIFDNNSNVPQKPVSTQLAIFLYRAGHYGNAASPEAIGHWAGVSPGTVANCTNRVMLALLSLHDEAVHLPTLEEKESAKAWVAEQVCPEWSNGHLTVDGTKFPLFQRPGLHGDTWFDKNKDYSLDCQVSAIEGFLDSELTLP
jgi:hypothetical protein